MKENQKIVQKELTHLGRSKENEMKHDSAWCKVGHTGTNKNFFCNLHAWKWQRKKKIWMFLGDTKRLSGTNIIKLQKRHMPWCDIAGKAFPVEKGNVDTVLQAWEPG